MARFCSTFGFLLFLIICTTSASGQTNGETKYYRYFKVQIDKELATEIQSITETFNDRQPYSLSQTCLTSNAFLLAVDANYPLRVGDMESEIRASLQKALPARRIVAIQNIAVNDLTTFCK